ncbi:GGDEF domain-containing protein [Jatrophihabitans telluris]|uniref:GGDEF domain-containing protein n=2 Tax=Jatrophihabitans telluris TaxID=2038343 RepID=A0ABY4R6D4_9ACTN|nr:GGDEF domain-containing protein [Jatrophihabitans telluris]UQX90346.1 GGDEF domain-containing protein [Jatrophihabitans telluris]
MIRLHAGHVGVREAFAVFAPAAVLSVVSTTFAIGATLLVERGPLGCGVVTVLSVIGVIGYRSHAATRRRHQALALVHEFVAGGVGASSLEVLADQLLSRIRTLLRAAAVEVLLPNEHARTGEADVRAEGSPSAGVRIWIGEDDQLQITPASVNLSDWVLVRALTDETPILIARNTKDSGLRRWLAERGLRDAIVVSLPSGKGLVGTLTVSDRLGETATFTKDDVTLLQTLVGHLAVAVESTRLVERLGHEATHDSLTGLNNRAYVSDRIDLVERAGRQAAVLMLDLNRFKEVNDVLGHEMGDRLLVAVGRRLRDCAPAGSVVARLGGDEFAILLTDFDEEQALGFAATVATAMAVTIQFDEAMLTPEASIGVAVTIGGRAAELLRRADTAMYEAKNKGVTIALHTPAMDQGRIERLALLADLRVALTSDQSQFVLHYQPKLDLRTGQVTGAEALVRWNHPTRGTIAPDVFIPLAESTGLIEQITPLVLDAALRECAGWDEDLTVAVNLSARNLADSSLPERVASALSRFGVPAHRLILEITESSVMGDPEQTMPVLHALRNLGTCLSLDDFGTGYSSLSYLQRLPVGEVKIDRSFVLGLFGEDDASSVALIRGITGLAATLGLRTVAEGIEDQAVLDVLLGLGCDTGQGYHLSRPLAAPAFRQWIAARNHSAYPALRLLGEARAAR